MASKKVASLFIDVSASTAKLTGGLNKAKAKVKRFQRETSKSFAGVKKAVFSAKGALLGLAGAGGFGMLVSGAMKTADEIGKMSDRLNMSAEAFQAMHHQAGLLGVSSQMVNSSVERMVKRLGEAAQGTGAAKKALDEMGVSAKDLINLNADEQYQAIAEAIGGLGTHAERAAATAAIFGREGIKMVNMLKDGKEGINQARNELEEFGIVMDRVQIKKIENANDSFFRIGQVIKGAGGIIASELAPYLEYAAKWFLENAKQAGGFGEIAKNVMSNVTTAIGWVQTGLDYMVIGWETLKLGVQTFAAIALKGLQALVEPIRYVNELLGRDQPEALKVLDAMFTGFEQAAIATQERIVSLIGKVGQGAETTKTALAEVAAAADSVANIQVAQATDSGKETPEAAAARVKAAGEAEVQQMLEINAWKALVEEEYRQSQIAAEKLAAETKMGYVKDTLGALGSLMSSKSKSLFKIGKMASIASATINTYEAVTKTMASVPYPFNIPLAAAQGIAGMAQVQGIRSQQMSGAREFGGPVVKDRSYLVGERGPEVFTPGATGHITANKDLGGSGGSKVVNFNISALDPTSIEEMLINNKQAVYNALIGAMNEEGKSFL